LCSDSKRQPLLPIIFSFFFFSISFSFLPQTNNVAILGFSSYEKILEAFRETRVGLGEILSAFEFFDRRCLDITIKHMGVRDPLSTPQNFYALIETGGSNKDHDDEKLASLLERLMEKEITNDGTVAQDGAQIAAFWQIREQITLALGKQGAVHKYDLSVPVPKLYELVLEMRERLGSEATDVVGYGHMGDGRFFCAGVVCLTWDAHLF